ncbi:MAG TPA: Asp-tRNA(Asn)/Glu-tRNA(Gln) amidotransferase subunit GatA [Candidatus Kapabacteria bacterium]|nr:Asp-tRNA(Asn)/Glu-tRNA(Gln) amidotransferase subunit GatA [Candidatus Kapabacteria bacterium]
MKLTSYAAARASLLAGKTSCVQLVREANQNITEGKHLNAFLSVFSEEALERAAAVDAKIKAGSAGQCAGMVLAVKDNINVKNHSLTCASKILGNFSAVYNATVIDKLNAVDAIVIGKTNMDEFAMGSSNENSAFGPVLNPLDTKRAPGGSSGGSAVAVAAGMAHAALGSETGGSVRQPAALCGVVGVKPTYGRVSRWGLVAFASSFDQIGPVAANVDDAALLLETISGQDANDSTSASVEVPAYREHTKRDIKGLRIGIPKEYLGEGVSEGVRSAMQKMTDALKAEGAVIEQVSLPHTEYCIATYYILTTAEASSNLARFDGVRYGYRAKDVEGLTDMYTRSRAEGFGAEVKRRIMLGTYVLSAGYYDAYYKKAQKVRRLIKEDFDNAYKTVDAIFTPTTPTTAFTLGEKTANPLEMYLNDIFTSSANIAGVPAISVPIGNDAGGLPVGGQIMTKDFDEATMFRIAAAIERNTH